MRSSLKAPKERENFSVARFFLKLVTGKMGKTKKDTNARVAGRIKKQIKEIAAKQLCMDDISIALNESNDS